MKLVVLTALFLSLTLASCASLPQAPGDLSVGCRVPDVQVGARMIDTIGEQRTALKKCANKTDRWIKFYESVR